MNKKLNQSGFGVLEVLLLVVILIAIGSGGYYVWHMKHNGKSPVTSSSSSSSTTANNISSSNTTSTGANCSSKGLNISEWSVSMPSQPTALGKVCYSIASNGTDLSLSSDLQKTMPASCNLTQASGPWGVTRYTETTVDASQKDSLIHIGNYYYQFVYPQEGCSQAGTLNTDYQTMVQSLEVD